VEGAGGLSEAASGLDEAAERLFEVANPSFVAAAEFTAVVNATLEAVPKFRAWVAAAPAADRGLLS